MHVVERVVIGLLAGLGFGLYGFFTKREKHPDGTYEGLVWRKLFRTMLVYGAAGALVGYYGDPVTQGRIEMATATTVIVGEAFDKAYPRLRDRALAWWSTRGC